jgi:hypothetical protein
VEESNGKKPFDQYAILELMGKVRLGGRVVEEQVFGVAMIRLDIPKDAEWKEFSTRYFHPNALYGITPVSKAVAYSVAQYNNTPPARAWELEEKPQLTAGADAEADAIDGDLYDDY